MPGKRCPYYFEARKKFTNPGGRKDAVVPYCAHKHSPAKHLVVLNTIGGARMLQCGGNLGKCQVPVDRRPRDS